MNEILLENADNIALFIKNRPHISAVIVLTILILMGLLVFLIHWAFVNWRKQESMEGVDAQSANKTTRFKMRILNNTGQSIFETIIEDPTYDLDSIEAKGPNGKEIHILDAAHPIILEEI